MPGNETARDRDGDVRGRAARRPGLWFLRILYNLVFPVAFLAWLPSLVRRMLRRGDVREAFWERFGIFGRDVRERLARRDDWIWIHAVSVGEMFVALRFIARLREALPGAGIVLSTTTSTGRKQAMARREPGALEVIYYPVDFPLAVHGAMRAVRPRAMVFVEAAPWPNMAMAVRRSGAVLAVIDARVSPRSRARYRRFRALARPLFALLDLVCVTGEDDAALWRDLGVDAGDVALTGSVKFDCEAPDPARVAVIRGELVRRCGGRAPRLLLGGSTWPGEEAALGRIFLRRRAGHPDLALAVVPRHVERSGEVRDELRGLGLDARLWSEMGGGEGGEGISEALVIDATGELRFWYALAEIAFVGKSLCSEGGQNPLEAAVVGVPVLFGPRMENFQAVADWLVAAGAAIRVRSEAELDGRVGELLAGSAARASFAGRATPVLAPHRGATARAVQAFLARAPG